MDKAVRIFSSPAAMKAEEYRYWQGRPAHERIAAVSELTLSLYAMKGALPDVPRLQRVIAVLPRPRR